MPYFAVYAPDYTDDDAINRRLAVRETHLANAAKNPTMSACQHIDLHMINPLTWTAWDIDVISVLMESVSKSAC